MKLSKHTVSLFQKKIWDFYKKQGRSFAWRNVSDPYRVLISELMLQQTQTHRVIHKFEEWMHAFPTFAALAQATLHEVLLVWQGLGYNRRGKYLHEISKKVVVEFDGTLPVDQEVLMTFPGIGQATAASISAFAFNTPTVFIETNIRTVFLYTFFQKKDRVHDREILPLVAQTVDRFNPREWYYALMDYGVMLKRDLKISNRSSAHYAKQSRFEGSDRQIRGQIIRLLTRRGMIRFDDLIDLLACDNRRAQRIIANLSNEGLIGLNNGDVSIGSFPL
ncbi:A/G-specific adenine glycosylase [Candidatus Dependentiae bacterium]|nr:MAG: A/G-specific adenine glycosylase [Candidatus Dependentiae bacterium]